MKNTQKQSPKDLILGFPAVTNENLKKFVFWSTRKKSEGFKEEITKANILLCRLSPV